MRDDAPMQYVIFVDDEDDAAGGAAMHTGPVAEDDARFLRERVLPTLQPLDDEAYMQGPAMILHTAARFSHVLQGEDLLWCVEWDPGLLVLRFSPDGRMAWTAVRSPVPQFGGREPLPQDVARYDEDAENPLYHLVFDAWDAQFEDFWRQHRGFAPAAGDDAPARYAAALRHADGLGRTVEARHRQDRSTWIADCQRRIRA